MSHLMPPIGGTQIDGNVQNIAEYHKRNLNDWNFAEHFEPNVFAQVGQFAQEWIEILEWFFSRLLNKLYLHIHMLMFITIDEIKAI